MNQINQILHFDRMECVIKFPLTYGEQWSTNGVFFTLIKQLLFSFTMHFISQMRPASANEKDFIDVNRYTER